VPAKPRNETESGEELIDKALAKLAKTNWEVTEKLLQYDAGHIPAYNVKRTDKEMNAEEIKRSDYLNSVGAEAFGGLVPSAFNTHLISIHSLYFSCLHFQMKYRGRFGNRTRSCSTN
jgi:hypothetical protein